MVALQTDRPSAPRRAPEPAQRVATGSVAGWLGRAAVNVGLLAAVLAFLGLAVGPHLFEYRTMTMLTGSMAPLIEPGDVTVVTPVAVADVQVGMILSYQIPSRTTGWSATAWSR